MTTPRAPLGRRLAYLARRRSLREILKTARRVPRRELECRRTDVALRRASHGDGPVLVGPFVAEVGYELLYWIPAARRLLREHRISADRVVSFSRGGAGSWYGDFASRELEILDLLEPGEFTRAVEERRAEAGDAKMLSIAELDRRLIARAREKLGPVTVLHPIVMYTRLRWLWQGAQRVTDVRGHGDYRTLRREHAAPALELPEAYVAVRPYFNDAFSDTAANREFLRRLLEELAERVDVVLLSAGAQLDEHVDWKPAPHPRIHDLEGRIAPGANLAVQSAVVAGARGFVSTYGGFSYLGPFLEVPTLAFRTTDRNPRHLEILRAALPGADYTVVWTPGDGQVAEFLERLRQTAGATRP